MAADIVLVTTTVEKYSEGETIARALLEEQFMACAQISGPIKSIYRWDGEIVAGEEFLVTVKTTTGLKERVIKRIAELHSYEVPEIIAIKPDQVNREYGEWVFKECNER